MKYLKYFESKSQILSKNIDIKDIDIEGFQEMIITLEDIFNEFRDGYNFDLFVRAFKKLSTNLNGDKWDCEELNINSKGFEIDRFTSMPEGLITQFDFYYTVEFSVGQLNSYIKDPIGVIDMVYSLIKRVSKEGLYLIEGSKKGVNSGYAFNSTIYLNSLGELESYVRQTNPISVVSPVETMAFYLRFDSGESNN
jgi:hypothetical protein